MIDALVRMRAVTKGRPRLGRRRKAYTPPKTEAFEREFGEHWKAQNPDHTPYTGPVGVRAIIGSDHIEVSVWELEEGVRPRYITGDADNYFKSIADSLNGLAYLDDKQVHHLEVWFTKEPIEQPEVIENDGTV